MNVIPFSHPKKPLMIAHRGASGLESENTAAAFVAAGNRSYFGIETDVHKTADGQYILIHDDNTERVTGVSHVVEETDLATLRALRVLDVPTGSPDRGDLVLPTLREYARICLRYGKKAVLELKNAFTREEVLEIAGILEEEGALSAVIFISFCYQNLLYLREKYPAQPVQFLVGKKVPDDLCKRLIKDKTDLDIYHGSLTFDMVRCLHENGRKVNVWTVNTPEIATRVADMGVDFITTNILE